MSESIVCADPRNCDRDHVGGMGGTPVHLPPDGVIRPGKFDNEAAGWLDAEASA